jgi:hypothetical protein
VEENKLSCEDINKIEKKGDKLRLYTDKPERVIPFLVDYARSTANEIISLHTLGPDLEDIFVRLTGGEP